MKLLRHFEDGLSIVFLGVYVTFQVGALTSKDIATALCCSLMLVWFLRSAALIQHNHVHVPVFYWKPLNELFSLACFFACGVPCDVYLVHHVYGHHRFLNQPGKDSSSMFDFPGCRYPDKPVARWRYVLTFPYRAITWSVPHLLRKAPHSARRRFLRSLVIVGGLVTWFAIQSPIAALCFIALPWLVVWFSLGWNNYKHHVGCSMEGPFHTANNDLSFKGWKGFAAGYHTAHHHQPQLHWSKLWRLHLFGIGHRIPPKYIHGLPEL